jgi:exodeoxyribonuclease VII small subunit
MDQPSINNLTFEQSLAELDRIVRELEDGQLGLEESLGRYETGVGLIKRCHAQLQAVEQRILQLTGTDGDGKPMTQPFQHSATSEMPRPVQKAPRSKVDEPDVLF